MGHAKGTFISNAYQNNTIKFGHSYIIKYTPRTESGRFLSNRGHCMSSWYEM